MADRPRNAPERAVVVGAMTSGRTRADVADSLEELKQLADTAGARVVDSVTQTLPRLNPATYIGSGKVQDLGAVVKSQKADLVIFDDDLSPVQVRNLEKVIGCKLLDRSGLILDIFASRARTAIAKTQVELAQLEYLRTRLTRQWTHLSRQQGGIGTRGPGETQIETDRRLIGRRMVTLKKRLERFDRQRTTQRHGRRRYVRISLVGYTNAGKSTLMNAITGSTVKAEDRLFATLDATTRVTSVGAKLQVLVSDTVGFIRKLPHNLIESFKSTLDEVRQSDLLLHVVDIASTRYEDHMAVVSATLRQIGAKDNPVLVAFNKIDQLTAEAVLSLKREYPDAAFISAERRIGMRSLEERLLARIEEGFVEQTTYVPVTDGKTLALIRSLAQVLEEHMVVVEEQPIACLRFRASQATLATLRPTLQRYRKP